MVEVLSNTMTEYVHTLLFMCPECGAPVAISEVRPEKNPEDVDAKMHRVLCAHCDMGHEICGVMAKTHWVNEWSAARNFAVARNGRG